MTCNGLSKAIIQFHKVRPSNTVNSVAASDRGISAAAKANLVISRMFSTMVRVGTSHQHAVLSVLRYVSSRHCWGKIPLSCTHVAEPLTVERDLSREVVDTLVRN